MVVHAVHWPNLGGAFPIMHIDFIFTLTVFQKMGGKSLEEGMHFLFCPKASHSLNAMQILGPPVLEDSSPLGGQKFKWEKGAF